MSATTTPRIIGVSRDQRTNRWSVTCPACGQIFEPLTTMSRYQSMNCPKPKCGREMSADYNAEPPIVRLVEADTASGRAQRTNNNED